MSYFIYLLRSFLPLALVSGLLLARSAESNSAHRQIVSFLKGLTVGLLAGGVLYTWAMSEDRMAEAKLGIYLLNALAMVVALLSLWLRDPSSWGGRLGVALSVLALSALGAFLFLIKLLEEGFSATTVLNTEAILHTASIVSGLILLGWLMILVAYFGHPLKQRLLLIGMGLLILILELRWLAEILLAFMRLEILEANTFLLSFVAKLLSSDPFFLYLQWGLFAGLIILGIFERKRVMPAPLTPLSNAQRRKQLSQVLREQRWLYSAVATWVFILVSALYYDLYASRPPTLSPATEVKADSEKRVRIKIKEVDDGKLHRFAYITEDGHRVRFFIINRYQQSTDLGVVYDACVLCGDHGYIQQGKDILCASCNVKVFVPSIGKVGGCNPIPLEHQIQEGEVRIQAETLENGKYHFSEIVSLSVKDPVTQKTLLNTQAPYQYQHNGHTYFFESEGSWQQFKQSPETYIP
ncbi:Fe-S-containing protein [Deltaproteobacteria bacterium TL4]